MHAVRGLLRRADWYIITLFAVIGLAALLPAHGRAADGFGWATKVAVGLLFFLYGARLSPQAVYDGFRHWRLHLPILLLTFVAFPLLGTVTLLLPQAWLGPGLTAGVLFLCVLPSTVQSSVAFTSVARGNVPAAICAASFSSLIGLVVTPLLAAWLLDTGRGGGSLISAGQVVAILVQLLLPFAVGQLLRRWISGWVTRHRRLTMLADRGSILLVVYSAFSHGMTAGIWHDIHPARLAALLAVSVLLFAVSFGLAGTVARLLGFAHADRVTAVFCGSQKSLASGLPIASVLFVPDEVGLIVLPLMIYHTSQLLICASLARRWSRTAPPEPDSTPDPAPEHPADLRVTRR
ncbi:bile acid:sodium symporter family protein [Streptomyces sp. NPDC087294]|uniref:bile acid:sodium symporter family protein n=1 Tax=Streptomyces sp. NPDC087294 TaxID=3365777 RepID=UPI0037FFBCAC